MRRFFDEFSDSFDFVRVIVRFDGGLPAKSSSCAYISADHSLRSQIQAVVSCAGDKVTINIEKRKGLH